MTPAAFALGVALQLVFLRPLRSDEREELSLLVTWAIALGYRGRPERHLHRRPTARRITSYANDSWSIDGYLVSEVRVYALRRCRCVILALLYLCSPHPVRALGARDRPEPARPSCSASTSQRVAALGFGLSVATATAAGAVYGMFFAVQPGEPLRPDLAAAHDHRAGRARSLGGAVVAALFMGVAEAVLAVEISPTWASLSFFLILMRCS